MKIILIATLISLKFSYAHADILFFNLNLSSKEIETAKKAAKARDEALIVIPEVAPEDQKRIESLKYEINNLTKMLKSKNSSSDISSQKISNLSDELQVLTAKYKIDNTQFDEILNKYENNSTEKLTSLIISGHHASYFFAENGSYLSYDELEKSIKKYPEATKKIKSIYLWGCYSLTKKHVVFWKRVIPSTYILSGWDGSAPKEDKAIDHDALFKVLTKEKNYSQTTDMKKSIDLFNSIGGVKESTYSLCVGSNYVSNHGSEALGDFLKICNPETLAQFKKQLETIENYRNAASEKYQDVPTSTASSELRDIYNNGRRIEHCDSFIEAELNKIIFLIFDKQVRKNIVSVYDNELMKVDKIFEKARLPSISSIFKNEKLKRSDAVKALNSIQLASFNSQALNISPTDKKYLIDIHHQLEELLVNQNCMRPIWIENVDAISLKKNISCMFSSSVAFPF